MGEAQWYEVLFENFARSYDREAFTQGTAGECDFLESEFQFDKSFRILDVGCGTGRHAIELTKRGYKVTGIDLSEAQLQEARSKANAENLRIDFRKQDARSLDFHNEFDAAIMLCEGAFPLMETDDMNFEILKGITRALKEHGKLIFTTLNGLYPLCRTMASLLKKDHDALEKTRFNLMTLRDCYDMEFVDDDGNTKKMTCNERYYMPSEITWLLNSLGYDQVEIFGAKLGAYSRNEALTHNDFEMLIVAQR